MQCEQFLDLVNNGTKLVAEDKAKIAEEFNVLMGHVGACESCRDFLARQITDAMLGKEVSGVVGATAMLCLSYPELRESLRTVGFKVDQLKIIPISPKATQPMMRKPADIQ